MVKRHTKRIGGLTMNRKETAERIKVMQAFVDGKQIQYKDGDGKWKDIKDPIWSRANEYRIKPEPKYRSFHNAEECWQEMLKHQPFGWVKTDEGYEQIWHVNKGDDFNATLKTSTFADGTPFGIKEE